VKKIHSDKRKDREWQGMVGIVVNEGGVRVLYRVLYIWRGSLVRRGKGLRLELNDDGFRMDTVQKD